MARGLERVDLANDEAARRAINDWVSEQTEERIEELLAPGAVDVSTRLVLTNAIYFQASWLVPFREEATADGTFHLADGTEVQVPMMHQQDRLRVRQEEDYTAVELPYVGGQLRMTVLMPAAGHGGVRGGLDAERLEESLRDGVRRGTASVQDWVSPSSSWPTLAGPGSRTLSCPKWRISPAWTARATCSSTRWRTRPLSR